jgi:hypothetical protein
MAWPIPFDTDRISLHTKDRISPLDARRQEATACEILKRLEGQPGLILADEVGMGKTFVALAVAASVAWGQSKGRHNPVIIMVPSSLEDKWPRDFEVFQERCLQQKEDREALRIGRAKRGAEFLKLLDDPGKKRCHIIFLTHGALSRSLQDHWTKLAILRIALQSSKLRTQKEAFPKFAAEILQRKGKYDKPELFQKLLSAKPRRWKEIIEKVCGEKLEDDPVPEAIDKVLAKHKVPLTELRDSLLKLPLRRNSNINERIVSIRQKLNSALQVIWRQALVEARIRSPLLILDEAHHLKNPATRLASLFVEPEAKEDAGLLGGELDGAFERMLFLTATPFQLGHNELLNVLDRFRGIRWDKRTISIVKEEFTGKQKRLEQALNEAYTASFFLDSQWKKITEEDLYVDGERLEAEMWWERVIANGQAIPEKTQVVLSAYRKAEEKMAGGEVLLWPWVIRHRRSRQLPESDVMRRRELVGAGIETDSDSAVEGIAIQDRALLPFLLAARSQTILARIARQDPRKINTRATFAEGLASCYEAFLQTRQSDSAEGVTILDEDPDSNVELFSAHTGLQWYLESLHGALPRRAAYAEHPKIRATVKKVLELWEQGEKVVVFCHFRATGKALSDHLSAALDRHFHDQVAHRLGCSRGDASQRLVNIRKGFQDDERAIYSELQDLLGELFAEFPEAESKEQIGQVIRRFVGTRSFLARYYPFEVQRQGEAFRQAVENKDGSGLSLRDRLRSFIEFSVRHCQKSERDEYLEALGTMNTDQAVRLVNGGTKNEDRRKVLLAFNSPFSPEVLIASSVLAEGVDLHLNCRYVIHHDLCWNPSTLEQRTGRVDRISAKAEKVKQPIHIYLPYLAATQDEKMYRVVRDRERWFQVLMGEDYRIDEASTDSIEKRIPLPEKAARDLAFNLEVFSCNENS